LGGYRQPRLVDLSSGALPGKVAGHNRQNCVFSAGFALPEKTEQS
jgi:hypothetical protein